MKYKYRSTVIIIIIKKLTYKKSLNNSINCIMLIEKSDDS